MSQAASLFHASCILVLCLLTAATRLREELLSLRDEAPDDVEVGHRRGEGVSRGVQVPPQVLRRGAFGVLTRRAQGKELLQALGCMRRRQDDGAGGGVLRGVA